MKRIAYLFLTVIGLSLLACQPKPSSPAVQESAEEIKTGQTVQTKADHETFPDITALGLDRNPFSLSDEIARHEITIVDFWASWCGPCRQEAPNLVATYQKYKDKGLGIIGVSLDQEFSAWEEAIKNLGLTWKHVSELRGWDDSAAQALGVRSIPHTIVVSKDGKILARELRGDELDAFVGKQLAK